MCNSAQPRATKAVPLAPVALIRPTLDAQPYAHGAHVQLVLAVQHAPLRQAQRARGREELALRLQALQVSLTKGEW